MRRVKVEIENGLYGKGGWFPVGGSEPEDKKRGIEGAGSRNAGLRQILSRNKAGIVLFLVALGVGLSVFADYGLSWDEAVQRKLGEATCNYVFHDDDELLKLGNRQYGVAFQLPLVCLENLLHLESTRTIYLFRHVITHFFFLFAAFHFYLLLKLLFDDEWVAVIGFLLLVLHPRLYGHSFFNSKDIPFLSMMTVCFYYGALSFKRFNLKNTVLYGATVGLLINIRIMGVVLVAGTLLLYLVEMLISERRAIKRALAQTFWFLLSTFIVLYATWPYLWDDPLNKVLNAFTTMSHYPFSNPVFYWGNMLKATELPWHYPVVWIGITTPLVFLFFIVFGTAAFTRDLCKRPFSFFSRNWRERQYFLYVLCSFGSLAAVIFMESALYDGWRQLFFVYPGLVLLGMYGLHRVFTEYPAHRMRIASVLVIVISSTMIYSMSRIHPFEHLFFNSLIPRSDQYLRMNFEMDYWGTSYRQALEKILSDDARPRINIAVANYPGFLNREILTQAQRQRINYVNKIEDADYFITNYRFHPWDYDIGPLTSQYEWYTIDIYNSKVLSVFSLRTPDSKISVEPDEKPKPVKNFTVACYDK